MATAGASVLASQCGLPFLTEPLLLFAILQALWVPILGTWRRRRELSSGWREWCAIGPAHEHSGIHTVPLGLAVIAGGLAALAAGGDGRWFWVLAVVCLGLTWLFTVTFIGRFVWALVSHGMTLQEIDGAWFLVPAALLGAGIATGEVVVLTHGGASTLAVLAGAALAVTLLGWLAYWVVLCVALFRVKRFGLGGVPQAPWWIAMGCAGLAAAALGRVLQNSDPGLWIQTYLGKAMVATDVVAIVLCVPVIIGSIEFLLRRCRFCEPASWPPTFSTAVFALGCLETGNVLHSPEFRILGLGAGYATLVLWAVTTAWNAKCTCARGFQRR